MARMIFDGFKRVMPDAEITFACPKSYHNILEDHPSIDKVIDSEYVDKSEYMVSYDISDCCIRHECKTYPYADKHRSDIWAEHCGVKLTSHDMHVPFISKEMINWGRGVVEKERNKNREYHSPRSPNIMFCPFAYDKLRTLLPEQIIGITEYFRKNRFFIYSSNTEKCSLMEELKIPTLVDYSTHEWLSFIHAADYVVTVDSAAFHYAGAISKPLTGIFTHVDGKFRGQYCDFILVQKHRDNGNWPCGPCYDYSKCSHPNCKSNDYFTPKPCITELTVKEIVQGIEKMFIKWTLVK